MSKVPQRDEIWRDKVTKKLVRINGVDSKFVSCYEKFNNGSMYMNLFIKYNFTQTFEFVGNGKPIDVLFEVVD